MRKNSEYSIRVEPLGLDLSAPHGANLASFLMQKGIRLRSDCGGKGVCGKCSLRTGDPANPADTDGETLACQVEVTADLLVEISLSSLIAPSEAIEKAAAFENLPPRPGAASGFGIAIDLGTTAMAGFLCDYATGAVPASAVVQNPQAAYGADVMSRICAAANNPEHLRLLRELAVSAADELFMSVTRSAGIAPDQVDEVVVVGNPTMLHLFLGVNPASIGQSPFEPAFRESRNIPASAIGLHANPRARVITLPLVSGFIGADLVSAALSRHMREQPDGTLLIDIGTNGEIILKANGGFYATSCATGPAFEGATIRHGMLAVSGAIDSFKIDPADGTVECTVIGRRANGGASGDPGTGSPIRDNPAGNCSAHGNSATGCAKEPVLSSGRSPSAGNPSVPENGRVPRSGSTNAGGCAGGRKGEPGLENRFVSTSEGRPGQHSTGQGTRGAAGDSPANSTRRVKARGICGSGLISAAAALLKAGIIDPTGRLGPHSGHPNLRSGDNGAPEFVLAPSGEAADGDVVLTQKDVRELQLAKGAIRTGIDMLCQSAGCDMPERIILAGSFGSHLAIDDLITIGLLPPVAPEKVCVVGNAAGAGAVMAAIDPRVREEAKSFAGEIQVVELATHPDFQNVFLGSLSFPERTGRDI
ncbi:MAG: ASKHA domain-containing protein [Syntrophobacter sp.]